MRRSSLITTIAGAALLALFVAAPSAQAGTVSTESFTFTGICAPADCVGTGTGILVLTGYILGQSLGSGNFVSFDYTSSVFPSGFHIAPADLLFVNGVISTPLPGPEGITLLGPLKQFVTGSDGHWCLSNAGTCASVPADFGSVSTFDTTAVPEPSAFALILPGLAGLAFFGRKRKQPLNQ